MTSREIKTPITEEQVKELQVGDIILISGYVLCGRDAVLPRLQKILEDGRETELGLDLHGQVMFHTAVSLAGIGPTSSNKPEIEDSIIPLSIYGVKIHLGKGRIHTETIKKLNLFNSIYVCLTS